jgi:hypothetical protein
MLLVRLPLLRLKKGHFVFDSSMDEDMCYELFRFFFLFFVLVSVIISFNPLHVMNFF